MTFYVWKNILYIVENVFRFDDLTVASKTSRPNTQNQNFNARTYVRLEIQIGSDELCFVLPFFTQATR